MDSNIIFAAIFIGIVSGMVGTFIANYIYDRQHRYDYKENIAKARERNGN